MSTVRTTMCAAVLAAGVALTGLAVAPAASALPRPEVMPHAGDPIYADDGVCAVGAYVTDGAAVDILTAGGCAELGDTWYADPARTIRVGTTASEGWPPGGSTFITLDPGITPEHSFDDAGDAYVGESACVRYGGGVGCGTVVALDATVTTPEGTVTNLIQTSPCEPGGAGTPLFDGGTLLGIQPFDDGGCASGGDSFFLPIDAVLQENGVTLY